MIYAAGSGNPGSTLSPIEMLVWLYDHELRIDPKINDGLIEIDLYYLKDRLVPRIILYLKS